MNAQDGHTYNGGHYNRRQQNVLGVVCFGMVVSTLAVGLRLLARRYLHVKLWWDDYLAVLALMFSYFPLICTIISIDAGLGRHISELDGDQIRIIGLTSFIHQISWVLAFALINLTILILYVRIFPLVGLHKACWIIGTFTVVWCVVNEIVLLTQCTPIRYFWNPAVKGHCINQNVFYAVAAVIASLNILVVFGMPLPIIFKLQMSRSKRVSIGIAFTIGTVACISAIVRLVLSLTIDHKDQTWSIAPPILWGCLEISTQVVSACTPSLMPLFMALIKREHRSSRNRYQGADLTTARGSNSNTPTVGAKNRKPRSFFSLGSAGPLPEGEDVTMIGALTTTDSHDRYDRRLIDEVKRSSERITVTDQIEQVSEPISEEDSSRQRSVEGFGGGDK